MKTDKTLSKEKRSLITPEFRVSFPHLFEPSTIPGSKAKYSVTMLFPKNTDMKVFVLAMKEAKVAKWGNDKSKWPVEMESPVVDGDSPKYAEREGYAGHWAIKASSGEDFGAPGVVDRFNKPILRANDIYPGCYARAAIFANAYDTAGNCGVSFILDHVQKLREGKNLGGRKSADQAFGPPLEAVEDSAGDDSFL